MSHSVEQLIKLAPGRLEAIKKAHPEPEVFAIVSEEIQRWIDRANILIPRKQEEIEKARRDNIPFNERIHLTNQLVHAKRLLEQHKLDHKYLILTEPEEYINWFDFDHAENDFNYFIRYKTRLFQTYVTFQHRLDNPYE